MLDQTLQKAESRHLGSITPEQIANYLESGEDSPKHEDFRISVRPQIVSGFILPFQSVVRLHSLVSITSWISAPNEGTIGMANSEPFFLESQSMP